MLKTRPIAKSPQPRHTLSKSPSTTKSQKRPSRPRHARKPVRFSTLSTSSSSQPSSTPTPLTILPVKVTNSLTGKLEPLTIRHAISPLPSAFTSTHLHSGYNNALTWYVCGPTVYDASHIGHARTYTNFDMMRRILTTYFRIPTILAMGVTDIDDKIITRATERQVHWLTLARHFENEFNSDLQRLNILPPDASLRVSEFIPDIIDYIGQLGQRGLTYSTNDGVYFDVQQLTRNNHLYAKLRYSTLEDAAQQVQKALLANDTSLFDEDASQPPQSTSTTPTTSATATASSYQSTAVGSNEKRHPSDFCLWKFQKFAYEPAFPSPFGVGRPGWHIECSAMTASALGVGIDIHSGGVDLKFPHHCNEIAQAEGCLGWGAGHLSKFAASGSTGALEADPSSRKDKTADAAAADSSLSKSSPMDSAQDWTSMWIHTGHLNIQGLKMSKSLKNFITIQQLFADGYTADEFRMLCATSPYSSTLDYTPVRLQQCRQELKNVNNFSELLQRTLTQTKLNQIHQYNTVYAGDAGRRVELDLNGNIVAKGGQAGQTDSNSQKSDKQAATTDAALPSTFNTLAHFDFVSPPPSTLNSDSSTTTLSPTEQVHYHKALQIRPGPLEFTLQQSLTNTQHLIHSHLGTDFNTQATISSLSSLISATAKYIAEKQQRQEPPSQHLLTQTSTYIYSIYSTLGFQFAGAQGGDWDTLATGQNKRAGAATASDSNSTQSSTPLAQDGVPVYLHQLANERYQLKQVALEGAKLAKQLAKNPPKPFKSTDSTAPPPDQIVLDRATYQKMLGVLKGQTQGIMGACDTIRDQVFVQSGYVLKDTASAAGASTGGPGGAPVAPYFIGPADKA